MSHFTVVKTQLRDQEALIKALADCGFPRVEVHEHAEHLYGYQGDVRPQIAEVIVRRKYVGKSSNDIGFKRRDDGGFEAIISEFDSRRYAGSWLQKLKQRYAYHLVLAKLAQEGFTLSHEAMTQDGGMRLTLRRLQ